MTIILVEDDSSLNFAIKLLLEKNGHKVVSFEKPDLLIDTIDSIGQIDLFILDIHLPGMDGLELMEHLKRYKESSFIFISAYTDLSHISHAFHLGCDDYLKKPFEIEELLIRIDRTENRLYPKLEIAFGKRYRYDFETKTLKSGKKRIALSRKESDLLETLLKNKGKMISVDTIKEKIWQEDIADNTISATIYRLRNKLDKDVILTFRDVGYMIP